jgi:hypothetical protein
MIKYSLICENGHQFDGWFSHSTTFDTQVASGRVCCPQCSSAHVTKALLAPHVASGRGHLARLDAGGDIPKETLEMLRKVRQLVKEQAEYVGGRFAEEVRKIHYDEAQPRSIYGEATAEEARELKEEGVEFYPLIYIPEDHN